MIESAGASRGLTANFCRVVFLGETAQAQIINEEGRRLRAAQTTPKAVAQSRQEVTNHAGRFCYLVDQVVVKDKPMSNAIICEVHRVLATGIETHADDVFPGEHRTHEVGVKYGQ
ncbi:Filamentation induced by cAMP/death on curing-related protein [Akanthomyces lecanii RCEF 1005]|uniref:Filamentation induced by cAMP/death on curing-related protein n=1 Tax=Akanthomyces lecanii RCEF 1005 TaxID=1081108 RepID=A0A162LDS1_CORDF|nr:Filamentation induced by cAMP/death on curing-related protein [Akanthomyces lecanii RCEF 1005]